MLPTAVAMALAVVMGYVGMFAVGAGYVGPLASYFPIGSMWIVAVGALSMVPAVWLGLAIGSRLPSALTPPVLAIAGVAALLVAPEMLFHASQSGGDPPGTTLLLPSVAAARTGTMTEFLTATARTHLTQVLWLAALATTGLACFTAASRRAVVAAFLPAVLGAALAVLLLPGRLSAAYVLDQGAIAPVCTADAPKVCVTRTHAAALDDLRGPARQALAVLSAKLPTAPTSVAEDYGSTHLDVQPQRAHTVLVTFRVTDAGRTADPPHEILWDLLAGAGTRPCVDVNQAQLEQLARHFRARLVAAAWLIGQPPPADPDGNKDRPADHETLQAWETLRGLPATEQRARVAALRRSELACDGRDLLDILVGQGGPR